MADQADIFADKAPEYGNQEVKIEDTTSQTPPISEFVANLVGEGKKYKTVDDLAKAYTSADDFIETLKQENNELREKVKGANTVDEVLERLQQQQTTQKADNPSLDVADLQALVERTVTGMETQKTRQGNLAKANEEMNKLFGSRAAEVFAKAAPTPELQEVYKSLASTAPEKFIALFKGNEPTGSVVDGGGGVNTTVSYSDSHQGGRIKTEGTKEYYDNIRRTNPGKYYGQAFQIGMDKAVRGNPDLYYGKK